MDQALRGRFRGLGGWALAVAWLSVATFGACGSEDSARKGRSTPGDAGAGGETDAPGSGESGAAGTSAATSGAAGSPASASGGMPSSSGTGGAGEPGSAGLTGESGAAGATSCASAAPASIQGVWTSDCNGYTCWMYFAESGAFANGCSNGQFESGSVADEGLLTTTGEGGSFQPYSTEGLLTRDDCDTLTRDYVAQTPPLTGPEESYSCELTRIEDCAPTLLEALVGSWTTSCGSSTCTSVIDANGVMTSTCSNGQTSLGQLDETGGFTTTGTGGGFPDYSTKGVIALSSCDSFIMPYYFQLPPNTGTKTSAQCSYARAVE